MSLETLSEKIGYSFKNEGLLELSLTHRSYANEHHSPENNQRLEYLGDAVLELVICEELYSRYPQDAEGVLSKYKSRLVCEGALCQLARRLELQKYMRMGHGESRLHGEERPGTLADAYEALIAAIYLDGGLDAARAFILRNHEAWLCDPQGSWLAGDAKSQLQEKVQNIPGVGQIHYELLNATGPEHARIFETCVWVGEHNVGSGKGKSKKESEQAAAEAALNNPQLSEIIIRIGHNLQN